MTDTLNPLITIAVVEGLVAERDALKNYIRELEDELTPEIVDLRIGLKSALEGLKAAEATCLPLQDTEADRYKRMFEAACVALGRINACLGLDPNDGGAEPIIDAIKELKAHAEQDKSFGEKYPRNPDATCKCEHWQACIDCHPTMLQSLEPVNAEPTAEIVHVKESGYPEIEWAYTAPLYPAVGTKLYTRPAPMQLLTDAERAEREKERMK